MEGAFIQKLALEELCFLPQIKAKSIIPPFPCFPLLSASPSQLSHRFPAVPTSRAFQQLLSLFPVETPKLLPPFCMPAWGPSSLLNGRTYHLLGELGSLIFTSVTSHLTNIMHHQITAPVQNIRHQQPDLGPGGASKKPENLSPGFLASICITIRDLFRLKCIS